MEAVCGRSVEDLRVWVDVAAEGDSAYSQPRVHGPKAEFDPARLAGNGDRHAVFRTATGRRGERVGVGVAADDAVEDHDVGGRNLFCLLSEICDVALDPVVHSMLLDECVGGGLVVVDDLDVGGVARSGFEQLDLQVADAAADLEHRAPVDSVLGERVTEPSGGAAETFAAVTAHVSLDGLGTEDGSISGWSAAVHRARWAWSSVAVCTKTGA